MKWHKDSKVLLQGIHHPLGLIYLDQMRACGTQLVAGVSPGHGGELVGDLPVFDLVDLAVKALGPVDISLILNPPYRVLDAALEAIAAGIRQLVIVSAGVPPLDMITLLREAQATHTLILGSGSQGIMVPEQFSVGTFDPSCYLPGPIGIISHCDRLTDDIAQTLSASGLGQSMVVSLGTDGLNGSNFEQWLQVLEEDERTETILLLGQPNSNGEMRAADYVASAIEKPVVAYLAGRGAKIKRHFGDSLTIVANQLSHKRPLLTSVEQTVQAFEKANIPVAEAPWELPIFLPLAMESRHANAD
ncbi:MULTISPECIES: CoA-binding protein [unclassified Synechocystis]|uniref:succinate--CoA ligase subunit alpha n=1 Tax=unclassified Synechocystis TaxID=2640012 RepID=UPI000425326F|nr:MULTISPECIES: CoA-binding protein [unclassified Synechocystis]MCT0254826.1 CoA-binding protein [Synechocystis sp. CS-94]